MNIDTAQLHHLDKLALEVGAGDDSHFWLLSNGQRAYVALAANGHDLLNQDGYTIAQALYWLDDGWAEHLMRHWRFVHPSQLRAAA